MPASQVLAKLDEVAQDMVQFGLASVDQLEMARAAQRERPGQSVAEILMTSGLADKQQLIEFASFKLNIPYLDPLTVRIDSTILLCVPAHLARRYNLIPVQKLGDRLTVVMADPLDPLAMTELQATYPGECDICICTDDRISQAVTACYKERNLMGPSGVEIQIMNYDTADEERTNQGAVSGEQIVNIVNNLIMIATEEKASDIHLDPIATGLKVRYRIDGSLHELQTVDKSLQLQLTSRIKVMAALDISEHRMPQDGRVRVKLGNRVVDLRIATYPTMWGEKVSIRLLNKDTHLSLDVLGLSDSDQKIFQRIISQPHGMFLVTGPTGSGKTTTLYSGFMRINRMDKHAISIEDPIENEILGVNQAQVNVRAGITFATALRSMLRHDPDIILVGEIRDGETADIASRAAMTGHLVFSTLHTNTALGAVARLVDLGLAPFMIASSLIGIMAQRLVRKLCIHCQVPHQPTEDELRRSQGLVQNFFASTGCSNCRQTGFAGRTGVFEVVLVDELVRKMIGDGLSEQEMMERLRSGGHRIIGEDGFAKVNCGITSIAEVLRVCRVE